MLRALVRIVGWPLAMGVTPDTETADAAVVLGAPLRPDGSLSEVLAERVDAGVALWRAGRAPLVVMTGGPSRGAPVPEGVAMAAAARKMGVPASALIVEDAARSTAENAKNVAPLLLPERRRVWVVTQPFHLRRALLWFRRVGFVPLGLYLKDSVQFRRPGRGLRWVLREYPAWVRDKLITTT